MTTKAQPVAAVESGVVAATPGQRLRVAVAHRAEQILAAAVPATWRLRMFRAGVSCGGNCGPGHQCH